MKTLKQLLQNWLEVPRVSDVANAAAELLADSLDTDNVEIYSFRQYLHNTVRIHTNRLVIKRCLPEILQELQGEEFIDSVIKRIKDKQL